MLSTNHATAIQALRHKMHIFVALLSSHKTSQPYHSTVPTLTETRVSIALPVQDSVFTYINAGDADLPQAAIQGVWWYIMVQQHRNHPAHKEQREQAAWPAAKHAPVETQCCRAPLLYKRMLPTLLPVTSRQLRGSA